MINNLSNSQVIYKKVVLIIAFRDFRDEEYFIPKEILEKNNIEVKTASVEKGTAIGVNGGETQVDILIEEINLSDWDGIIFVGGPGALKYLDNENSYKIAREAVSQNKILGAICISPVILAKAGVLNKKQATVWSSPMDKEAIKILEENDAIYQDKSVVIDKNIITANGPAAAEKFAHILVQALTKK